MEQANVSLLIAGEAHLPGGGAVRVHRSFSEPPCVPRLTDVPEHPLHTDRPPFPRTPPCTHCVTARHLLLALRLVRKPRMPGGLRPTLFCTPQLPISQHPRPPCVTTPPELASPCLPGEGFSIPGQIRSSKPCITHPWQSHSRLWRGYTDRMCRDRAIGCGGSTAPQHRRTVGPCVSLANHSCDYADCRGRLRQTL